MRRCLGFALLVLLAALCVTRIVEHDTPWYLAAGDLVLRTHALPRVDPFSYTSNRPWLNHEWLAEVLLAAAFRGGGFVALGAVQGGVIAGSLGLLAVSTRKRGGLDGVAPWLWVIAAFVLREWLGPRAVLLSLPCFCLTLALVQSDDERAIWWCVPVQLVWTQVHGGNPTGVALVGLAFLAAPSLRRAAVATLCAAATVAGPYGLEVHAHFLGAHSALPTIREWEPVLGQLLAGSVAHWAAVVLVLVAGSSLLGRRGARTRRELATWVVFAIIAYRYQRFSLEAALVAVSIAAPIVGVATRARAPLWVSIGGSLALGGLLALGSTRSAGVGLDPKRFPVEAVAWLRQHHPPGPMFNSYNYGGYLLWAWPEQKVFIDGRAFTVYDPQLVSSLPAVYAEPERFVALVAQHQLRLAVLQREGRGAPLVRWLSTRPEWAKVYEDAMTVIFVRSS